MTVSTTENRKSYAGNGVTAAFSFPYVFFADADLVVLKVQPDGTFTKAALGTDYTVSGAGNEAGGSVTMAAPPAAGTTLVIYRDPQLTQPMAFVDNDPLPAKSVSRGYDRLTAIAQRIRELVDRSFRLSDADTSGASPILPPPTPNAFIGWNGSGNGLINRTITDLITISAYGTAVADQFTGDGTKKDFTLTANPGALANMDVAIGGVVQTAGKDFTWDGSTKLSFVAAPPAPTTPGDTNIYVRYLRALPQGYSDAAIVNWKDNAGVARDVQSTLQRITAEVVSVKDPRFGAKGDGATDDTAAFLAAFAFAASQNCAAIYVPDGPYRISGSLDIPAGRALVFSPGAKLLFTSTASPIFRVRRGTQLQMNGASVNATNPAWNGDVVLLDGSDHFLETYPTAVSGVVADSATFGNGTLLHLQAVNAGEFVSFVKFGKCSAGQNLNYAIVLSCGSSGVAGTASTWHWINSNVFDKITSFAKHFSSLVGTRGTPAEVAANVFRDCHHQCGASSALPMYFYGASNNVFEVYVWDWDNAQGSPIVFDGGAVWNQVQSNVDTSVVTTAANNKVEDFTGGETGQKYYWGGVSFYERTYFGRLGVSGQYAKLNFPDVPGSTFWEKNDGLGYVVGTGLDPYSTPRITTVRDNGTFVVGSDGNNSTVSTLRVNGAASRSAMAVRMGTDGFAGILFENSAGTNAGTITVNTSSTVYGTSSDYRLKANVRPMTGALEKIGQLRPVTYTWKVDGTQGQGFIAHELQAVFPDAVVGRKDGVFTNDEGETVPVFQAIDTSFLVGALVAAIQELKADFDQYKASHP